MSNQIDPSLPDATPDIEEMEGQQRRFKFLIGLGAIALLILGSAMGIIGSRILFIPTATPSPTAPAIAAITATDTPTPMPATPTFTPSPTELPPSPTQEPTSTLEPTQLPTEEPTNQPTTEPTLEPTQQSTSTPTNTPEPTLEPSATSTFTPSPEPTATSTPTSVPLSGKIAVPVFQNGMYNIYLASAADNWTPKLLFGRASQPAFSKDGRGMMVRSWNHPDWAQSIIYLPDYTNLAAFRQMTKLVEDAHPALNTTNEIIYHRFRKDKQPLIIKLGTHSGAENDPKNQVELAEGENPDWLGQSVIFYASFPKPGLYIMDAGGGNKELILGSSEKLVAAASPDGGRVAVSLNQDGRHQIFTFSVGEGTVENLAQLTSTADADNRLPAWSPNGDHIAFASNRADNQGDNQESNWAVWVMNSDGSDQRKLFDLPGSIDGKISAPDIDKELSCGCWEERISWAP